MMEFCISLREFDTALSDRRGASLLTSLMLQWNQIHILPLSSGFFFSRKNKTFCPVVGAHTLIKGHFFHINQPIRNV